MAEWKLSDIADAVSGELIHAPTKDVIVTSVSGNTRELEEGAIFVPFVAERNGHDFIDDAISKGAVASFWSEEQEQVPAEFPVILVDDTERAFKDFAKWYLNKVKPKVVGITGSNGKTTTKDMTFAILSTKFNTHKTPENENNQLGVPKTILSMPADTEVLVLEMGMSSPGEISILSKIGEPDVAVVTMVGESHIQAFGSREKLAKEKLDVLAGLKAQGLFIRPADEPLIMDQFDHSLRNQTFGWDDQADIYATDVESNAKSTIFTVHLKDGTQEPETIKLPVPGKYNVNNALIALAIGLEYGISFTEAKKGLENLEMTKNRLEWIDGKNETHLLNDAYNASPTSMTAALNYFADIELEGGKIVVLGDILELGDDSKHYHENISQGVDLANFKAILLYGDEMKALYEKIKDEGTVQHFSGEKDELIATIEEIAQPKDSILFKSSNGTDLLSVVGELKN